MRCQVSIMCNLLRLAFFFHFFLLCFVFWVFFCTENSIFYILVIWCDFYQHQQANATDSQITSKALNVGQLPCDVTNALWYQTFLKEINKYVVPVLYNIFLLHSGLLM